MQPLYNNELRFESDKHIGKIQCPVMILHAEDDNVVPFSLGEKVNMIKFSTLISIPNGVTFKKQCRLLLALYCCKSFACR